MSIVQRTHQRSRRAGFEVLATLAMCFLAGCGGGSEESAARAVAQVEIDPCSLVTAAEAEAALGGAAAVADRPREANLPPRLATCRYRVERGPGVAVLTVLVRQGEGDSEARIGFQQSKEQFPGAEAVSGLGDDAFWYANQINVLQGRVYLNITGDFDLATARQLAEQALTRLR